MENNSRRLIDLANKKFGEILTDGFKLFSRSYGTLILPLAFFQVLIIILDTLLLTDLEWRINSLEISMSEIFDNFMGDEMPTESELNEMLKFLLLNLALIFLQNLIAAFIITLAICSVSTYLFKKYMGYETNFMESFKSAFNKRIFIVLLILGILMPIGTLLLYIPAIIIFYFFIFLVYTYNMESDRSFISEARSISRGAFWKVIGIFAIHLALVSFIGLIFNSIIDLILNTNSDTFSYNYNMWLNPDTRNFGMLILYRILTNFIDIILAPLFICLLTSLFSSLKSKKDLALQYEEVYYPTRKEYPIMHPESPRMSQELREELETFAPPKVRVMGDFYCPFCGYLIEVVVRLCPNCGEDVGSIVEKM